MAWIESHLTRTAFNVGKEPRSLFTRPSGSFVITARNAKLAKLNLVMQSMGACMDSHRLELAFEKTEIVILTRKCIPTIISTPDNKLTFAKYIRNAASKAALRRLMANICTPNPGKRKLLMATVQSILLYVGEM